MKKKFLSIILVVSILFTTIPRRTYAFEGNLFTNSLTNVAEDESNQTDTIKLTNTEKSEQVPLSEKIILVEDERKRDEYTKYFLLEDKSYAAVQYPYEVHYKDSAGNFQEIDNRFILNEGNNKSTYP